MDEYDAKWKEDDGSGDLEEAWLGEDELCLAGIPEAVWSDWSLKEQPPPPDFSSDLAADEIETNRLLEMKVLVKPEAYQGQVEGRVTTKFVRDWRKKLYVCEGQSSERWMRRNRLVAREYATVKRDDTFSPATGPRSSNLLPLLHLQRQTEGQGSSDHYEPLLAALDIKETPSCRCHRLTPSRCISTTLASSFSRTCQGRDRDPKHGIGTCIRFWGKICSLRFVPSNHTWQNVMKQQF